MFKNRKISTKIILGFLLVSLIPCLVGGIAVTSIKTVADNGTLLYEWMTVPIQDLGEISTAYQKMRVNVREIILNPNPQDKQTQLDGFNARVKEIETLSSKFEKTIKTDKMHKDFDAFNKSWKEVQPLMNQAVQLAMSGRSQEAYNMIKDDGAAGIVSKSVQDNLTAMIDLKDKQANELEIDNTDISDKAIFMMLLFILAGLVLSIILGIIIAKIISRPIKQLRDASLSLSMGDTDVEIVQRSNDEVGQLMGAFGKMVDNIVMQASNAQKIADGDLSLEIEPKSEKDILAISMKKVVEELRKLIAESDILTKSAVKGQLTVRGRADQFSGGYRQIISGVNETLDAVVSPLYVAADYFDRISKGDIPEKITDSYNGDFELIINNLNTCIEAVNKLVEDASMLSDAAVNGDLQVRADAGKHEGDFAKIITGVNNTLDAVINPLTVAAEYFDRISKGDIPKTITDVYPGDFKVIIGNINTCIDAVNMLVEDASMLAGSAVQGKLDARADAGRHSGDFAKIITGVNNTLDAVINPLYVAADYVDRISKGDIPEKITETYYGDFNVIKNNLNICIDAINKLVSDAAMLANAGVEGKLDIRADVRGHQGDFAAIVKGVNETLDAVIKPSQEVSDVLLKISQGRLDARVTGDYKGDHAVTTHALNNLGEALQSYIEELSSVLSDMAEQNFTRSIEREYVGDFIKLKTSINYIIDHFNHVLSEINSAADQVERGVDQIASSSQTLSQGATEQASSVQEISATITEVSENTKRNATNANTANELSLKVMSDAQRGNEQMIAMLSAMNEIKESSKNIAKIIKVIDDIAFQTNILALNAAVEAARAGSHGKGFAVVAEEVRNLAARSAKAAEETTSLIDSSIDKVEDGSKIANETADALGKIVEGVAETVESVGSIAEASVQQAGAISQIDSGINQISQVTQTNSATAEESAAASEEIAGQTQLLKGMIDAFKLRKSTQKLESTIPANRLAAPVSTAAAKRNLEIVLDDSEFGKY